MKIGIVTYHRTLNYGAVMQSLATRFVLEEMGHEVYYVDYWPDYHKEMYALFPIKKFFKQSWRQKAKLLWMLMKYYKSKKRRIDNFDIFFQAYIYPYCRSVDEPFDVVIYGSDQIWRKQKALGAYNPFYFGNNKLKAKHHISYAASMGVLPDNDADKAKVKELVSHIEKISVREEDLQQLLKSLGFADVYLTLDPTLLLSSGKWDKYLPTEPYMGEKYALVYLLDTKPFDLKKVQEFANNKGLKLVILQGYATSKETKTNLTSAGPYEFVRLIKNAEYVFSASFHGLVFAIIYGKQVFASFKTNAGRAKSLLKQLGMSDRLIAPLTTIPEKLQPVNYEEVHKKMSTLRRESLDYLMRI